MRGPIEAARISSGLRTGIDRLVPMKRLRELFTTLPGPVLWARLGAGLLLLLLLSWLLDRLGLARWHPDPAFLLGFGLLAGIGTSLAEETLFRGVLLRPPP